jgi:6-pyruvoyltetrahydropterin/6-carboxytetrahydropterin synthase
MYKIKSEVQFDMAHFLEGYDGKCSNIHGHRYRVEAVFASETVSEDGSCRGMVADFTVVKDKLKEIGDCFDHKLVIEDTEEGRRIKSVLPAHDIVLVPYRPTAELMARDIYTRLKNDGCPVCSVEVFETPTNSCEYSE